MNKIELKALIVECLSETSKVGDPQKSQWGSPDEILGNVMTALEHDVEWPLTEIMEYNKVLQLLAPIRSAVNAELLKLK